MRFKTKSIYLLGVFVALMSVSSQSQAREPWDLSYLLDVDPNQVTLEELHDRAVYLEDRYRKYHVNEGIIWQAYYESAESTEPDYFGSGGDSAIFTGHYLAAATYRYLVTQELSDLDKVLDALRGLHILTHISGTPGVIARCAFPADQPERWRYPDTWQGRIVDGLVYESPENIPDILNRSQTYPKMIFYTKGTNDQLTGIVLGISVVWAKLHGNKYKRTEKDIKIRKAREIVEVIAEDLYKRLTSTEWEIKDHMNKTGNNARYVDGTLKLNLLALYKDILYERRDFFDYGRVRDEYQREFDGDFLIGGGSLGDLFNWGNLFGQYFAWNLRIAQTFGITLLEKDPYRLQVVRDHMRDKVWNYIKDHQNTHFAYLYNAANPEAHDRLDQALFSLKAHSLRPTRSYSSPLLGHYEPPSWWDILFTDTSDDVVPLHLRKPTTYFIWQKGAFDVGEGPMDKVGYEDNTGLDFLLPYWMGRYENFF